MYLTYLESKDFSFIARLAEQALSQPVFSARRLQGLTAFNYEVNYKYIFKLPNEYTNIEDWMMQSKMAPKIQKHLDFQIPIPSVKNVILPNRRIIGSCFYEKIPGEVLIREQEFSNKDNTFKQKFFEQVSQAAFQIHNIPLEGTLSKIPTKIEYLKKCFFKTIDNEEPVFQKTFDTLISDEHLGLGKSGLRDSLLIHTDLHPGNILLDEKNNIKAVLDFNTAVKGDHFLEFRPNLYSNPNDMKMFQEIFQQTTNVKINPNEVKQLEVLRQNLSWLSTIYKLYRLSPSGEKKQKLEFELRKKMHEHRMN